MQQEPVLFVGVLNFAGKSEEFIELVIWGDERGFNVVEGAIKKFSAHEVCEEFSFKSEFEKSGVVERFERRRNEFGNVLVSFLAQFLESAVKVAGNADFNEHVGEEDGINDGDGHQRLECFLNGRLLLIAERGFFVGRGGCGIEIAFFERGEEFPRLRRIDELGKASDALLSPKELTVGEFAD